MRSKWIVSLCIALLLCRNILQSVSYIGVGVGDKIEIPLTIEPRAAPKISSIGYIHIGKTGGSTISQLLRNGCHSYMPKPCRVVASETVVSKLVEHYYHIPDFHALPESGDESYILSVRDVYDRTVSAFLYTHPKNTIHFGDEHNMHLSPIQKERTAMAYRCFPTLETFASLLLSGTSTDCDYPYQHNTIVTQDCSELACAAIHGKVRIFPHLFFNYRNILYTKLPTSEPSRTFYAIRMERLWQDWSRVNNVFGQQGDALIPSGDELSSNTRNITGMKLPVTREISDGGRTKLCEALTSEYVAYFVLLRKAENLNANDFEESRKIAVRNCPHLELLSIIAYVP